MNDLCDGESVMRERGKSEPAHNTKTRWSDPRCDIRCELSEGDG